MQWRLRTATTPQNFDNLEETLLANRGLADEVARQEFFKPTHPLELSLEAVGLSETAVDIFRQRLLKAKDTNEHVVIFGDYDADGICATAVMWEALREFGITAVPFIPRRDVHGYGLSMRSATALLEEMSAKPPTLIVTVDNGIVANEAVRWLSTQHIDVLITDHHHPDGDDLPPALAIFHTTQLCGTTVAWMLGRELAPAAAEKSLDLCGIATMADQVPLLRGNRSFAMFGLSALKKTTRVGLKALLEYGSAVPSTMTSSQVIYQLVPRINALGRLAHGLDALRLICTKSKERAWQLAQLMEETNRQRQSLTTDMFNVALQQAELQKTEAIIVLSSTTFHEGVIGLIASKITETYLKPSVVLAIGESHAKGSARSIAGIHITDLMRKVREHVVEVGGHAMAGGLSVEVTKIEIFQTTLQKLALTEAKIEPTIELECQILPQLLTLELFDRLEKFEPFGQGNQTPLYLLAKLKVAKLSTIGKLKQHLKIQVTDETGKSRELLCWQHADWQAHFQVGDTIDAAVTVDQKAWNGVMSIQLVAQQVRLSESV